VAAARRALQRRQKRLDPRRLVFIDETSVSTTITRLYGRAPRGERLIQKVLHGNWKTVTFIAALRNNRVTAPFVLEGAMNGETFKAYVEQFLAPTLKKGDIVFMDNASVHMVEGVEEAIEARGAILFYLPAYSPDLNPIEQFFAKLKSMLRKIAAYSLKQAAYTVDSLCVAIASSLTKISRSECSAYLTNSGYRNQGRQRRLPNRRGSCSLFGPQQREHERWINYKGKWLSLLELRKVSASPRQNSSSVRAPMFSLLAVVTRSLKKP